jgi:hypothetical protein
MPFNGSGIFSPPSPPVFPAVPGTTIKASDFNSVINDLVGGLSQCVTRDGQSTITGVLQWSQPAQNLAALGGVGLTGNQTIAGVKTFSSPPKSSVAASAPEDLLRKGEFFAEFAAVINTIIPPGTISAQARLAASPRWLLVDGRTIGNAASGATARANADTWLLYEQMWAFPAASVPIFTSAGAPSTRGATALADFNAGKRIPLFTPDGGAFLRMWAPGQTVDPGRVVGSVQAASRVIVDWYNTAAGRDTIGNGGFQTAAADMETGSVQETYRAGEARWIGSNAGFDTMVTVAGRVHPYSLAVPHYIFLGVV